MTISLNDISRQKRPPVSARLGVDGKAFVIQLITFVLAYLVLRRYAFGPILKVLRERRADHRERRQARRANARRNRPSSRRKIDKTAARSPPASRRHHRWCPGQRSPGHPRSRRKGPRQSGRHSQRSRSPYRSRTRPGPASSSKKNWSAWSPTLPKPSSTKKSTPRKTPQLIERALKERQAA